MSFYTVALFAHMLGVLGLFTGIGLQWTSFLRFRRAQFVAQVREWASLTSVLGVLMPAASLWTLVQTSGLTLVGVVFLMIIKPDLVGSLITLAVALVLGVGSARIFARPRQGIASGKEVKQRHHAQDEAIATGGWYAQ